MRLHLRDTLSGGAALLAFLSLPPSRLRAERPADLPLLPAVPAPPGSPPGLDVAAREHGARILSASSAADRFEAEHLIDGYDYEEGWASVPGDPAPTVVIAFRRDTTVRLGAIAINPDDGGDPAEWARTVRLWSSPRTDGFGWTPLGRIELPARHGEVFVVLPDVEAAVLKLTAEGTGPRTGLGSLRCYEGTAPGYVPLARRDGNVASFAAGAHVVSHTPGNGLLYRLLDGHLDRGWRGRGTRFPFDVVLAFRDNRPVRLSAVQLWTGERPDGADRVKELRLAVSNAGLDDADFREIGAFPGAPDRDTLRAEFPPAVARFLRVTFAANAGDPVTSVREIRVEETPGDGVPSIFDSPEAAVGKKADGSADPSGSEAPDPADEEREPNDTPDAAQAIALNRTMRGGMGSTADRDWFAFRFDDPAFDLLKIHVVGRPYLKTELRLLTKEGREIRTLHPAGATGAEARLTVPLDPGEYRLRVAQPPSYIVMVFDCSGSMADRMDDLRAAAAAYLDQMTDSERIHLIRFGDVVEHLNEGFTSDREALKKAVQGKLEAAGGTALYDAVGEALSALDREPGAASANRAVVLLSDGLDTSSRSDAAGFWRRVQSNPVRPYVIALGSDLRRVSPASGTRGIAMLRTFVDLRGGKLFETQQSEELTGLYCRIAAEMTRDVRYELRLEPDSSPEGAGSLRLGVSYDVLDPQGRIVARGAVGRGPLYLPAGRYTARLDVDPPVEIPGVEVEAGRGTALDVVRREGRTETAQAREDDPVIATDPAGRFMDHLARADSAVRKGELERAALELEAAAAEDGGNPALHLVRGRLLFKQGNLDGARAEWLQVDANPSNPPEAEQAVARPDR